MATWLRSRDGDVCPWTGEALKSAGSKYEPFVRPCETCEGGKCIHLSRAYAGAWNVSVLCKFKADPEPDQPGDLGEFEAREAENDPSGPEYPPRRGDY